MKKGELVTKVHEQLKGLDYNIPKRDTALILDTVFNTVFDLVVAGEEVHLGQLGKLTTIKKKERKGRNPQTGEEMVIPAHKAVKYKPSKMIKDAVK